MNTGMPPKNKKTAPMIGRPTRIVAISGSDPFQRTRRSAVAMSDTKNGDTTTAAKTDLNKAARSTNCRLPDQRRGPEASGQVDDNHPPALWVEKVGASHRLEQAVEKSGLNHPDGNHREKKDTDERHCTVPVAIGQ